MKKIFFSDYILRYFPILYFYVFVMLYVFYYGEFQTYSKARVTPVYLSLSLSSHLSLGMSVSTMQPLLPLKETRGIMLFDLCILFYVSLKDKYNHNEFHILRRTSTCLFICVVQIGLFENCCISEWQNLNYYSVIFLLIHISG